MMLAAGQRIYFRGRNGAARAADFLLELKGQGDLNGAEVILKHDTMLVPRVFKTIVSVPSKSAVAPLEFGNSRADAPRTSRQIPIE